MYELSISSCKVPPVAFTHNAANDMSLFKDIIIGIAQLLIKMTDWSVISIKHSSYVSYTKRYSRFLQ
jgi:hypothetical protein